MKAVGELVSGISYLRMGKFNRKVSELNAANAQTEGVQQEAMSRERTRAYLGAQVVSQAGSGFDAGQGSFGDQLLQSQVNGYLDALAIRSSATAQAQQIRQQGALAAMQAKTEAVSHFFGAAKALQDQATAAYGGGGG